MFPAHVCPLIESNTWSVPETEGAVPQGGYGHTSTYDAGSGSVYVHGGYKVLLANKYGLVDDLYRYNVNSRTWLVITHTLNHVFLSCASHAWDLCDTVYYVFSCHARLCFRYILKESGFPRYLHSAVILSGTLLIFGGNTHNDTSLSNGAKCFSADFLAYDIGKTPDVYHVLLKGEQ